jgi:hypothetical protein
VLVKTDREIALRLSAEEKLAPANLFLVTRRWDEAVNTVPPCERGVPRGDCLYTRALAREGAAYAGFLADPTPEQAREARAALMQAVADYEAALSADSRERVIAANAARVRTLLVEWEKFVDYTAWMRTATPPENLPDRNPVRVTAAPGASKDGTGGDRTFSTNEHRFRTAVRAELEQREQPPDEAFITAKAAEAAYFQPPIPGPDARQIALEEVKAWLAMREKWRIYREKVLIFMEDEKVTEATRQRLKFWEESLGIDPAVAGALREEAAKSAPARRTGVRKQ